MNLEPSLTLYAKILEGPSYSTNPNFFDYPVEVVGHGWQNCDLDLERRSTLAELYSDVKFMSVEAEGFPEGDARNYLLVAKLSKRMLQSPSLSSLALDHKIIPERVPVRVIRGE